MQLEIEEISTVKKTVKVSVPVSRVDAAFSKEYAELARRVSIPGFRRGRVPKGHLKKRYGRQVSIEVTQSLLEAGWSAAVDKGLKPVGEPAIDPAGPVRQGKPFDFTITVEVIPEFELLPFEDLKADVVQWTATDAVVDHELEHVAERAATWEPVGDRDTVEEGDQIVFDFTGRLQGEDAPFDGGSGEDVELEIGGGRFIPGFEEQLVGQKVGADVEVEVTFPDDYHADNLAGKPAVFACMIKAIKTLVVPPIDDTLPEKVGEESMDTLRGRIREMLVKQQADQTDREAREAIRTQVGEQYTFPLPDTLVEGEVASAKAAAVQKAKEDAEGEDIDADQIAADAEVEARERIQKEVRAELVLDKLAEQESIEVTPREISAFLDELTYSMGPYGYQLRNMYRDPNRLAGLRRRMRHDKVLDFLLTRATVTTVEKDVPEHVHDADHENEEGTAE